MIKNTGKFNDSKLQAVIAKLEQMKRMSIVVGVPASKNTMHDDADLNLATLAAIHEFGATIKHQGGTNYGYRTEKDAKSGKNRFLKAGSGYMVTGKTGEHTVTIPERSFLRASLEENKENLKTKLAKAVHRILFRDTDVRSELEEFGRSFAGLVTRKIQKGIDPPNRPSTIAAKKSSKPLIGKTGQLSGSITWEVRVD